MYSEEDAQDAKRYYSHLHGIGIIINGQRDLPYDYPVVKMVLDRILSSRLKVP